MGRTSKLMKLVVEQKICFSSADAEEIKKMKLLRLQPHGLPMMCKSLAEMAL
jgi:hypothetical protein